MRINEFRRILRGRISPEKIKLMRKILIDYEGCIHRTSIESGMSFSAVRKYGIDIIEKFRKIHEIDG